MPQSAREWRWITPELLFAIHDRQLAEHGGSEGIRDLGLIESALARPRNLATYGNPDAADLAAAYICGVVKDHGFVDGNKRMAWICGRVFLADNGYRMAFDPLDAVRVVMSAAAGTISERDLADWIRERLTNSE